MNEPDIGQLHATITPVGSRITCTPPPTDTDRDWLVLVAWRHWTQFCDSLQSKGWKRGGSAHSSSTCCSAHEFASFTLGIDNVIATSSEDFHRRFLAATSVARRLNLLLKPDRVALFQAVIYGNDVGAP